MKKLFLLLVLVQAAFAQPKVPELKSYATDLSSTLSGEQLSALNNKLKTFEDTTSNQLVMLMIPTLDDYPIEDFAIETAEKNKIGTANNDNGILLLIAKNDRKLRIEVGYGLEGPLPDALSNSIIRNVIVPHFRRDEYYEGISAGIDAIIAATAGEYKAVPKEEKERKKSPGIPIIFLIILIIFFLSRRGRRRMGPGGLVFLPGMLGGLGGSSRGSSWGGGGGGFGGFSGGGGSFGGGGSSGSW